MSVEKPAFATSFGGDWDENILLHGQNFLQNFAALEKFSV